MLCAHSRCCFVWENTWKKGKIEIQGKIEISAPAGN